jgi:hypothetical protein
LRDSLSVSIFIFRSPVAAALEIMSYGASN